MTGTYDRQEQVKSILSRRYIISIYAKRKSYYISRCLRRRLEGRITLRLDPKNRYCLILEQERIGEVPPMRGCAGLWKSMGETMRIEKDARFLFFPTENRDRWVGYLLPDWNNPILWEEMFPDEEAENIRVFNRIPEQKKTVVLWQMKRRYWGLLDCEEVEFFWKIGECMAARMGADPALWNILSVFCADELIQKDIRENRRAKAAESGISLNRQRYRDSSAEIGYYVGTEDEYYKNMFVEEFKNGLTVLERFLLRKLEMEEDINVSSSLGTATKQILAQTLEMIRYKAVEYFGKSYIESFFVRS